MKTETIERKLKIMLAGSLAALAVTTAVKAEVPMASETFEPYWQIAKVDYLYTKGDDYFVIVDTGKCYLEFLIDDFEMEFTDGTSETLESGDFVEVFLYETEDKSIGICDMQFVAKGF